VAGQGREQFLLESFRLATGGRVGDGRDLLELLDRLTPIDCRVDAGGRTGSEKCPKQRLRHIPEWAP